MVSEMDPCTRASGNVDNPPATYTSTTGIAIELLCIQPSAGGSAINSVFNTTPVRRGRSTARERVHEFLEREGRPEATPIRDWIEYWYSRLPRDKRLDIRGRLRSGDSDRFTEAYFELQMFALLMSSGHEVCVEPALANGRFKPDFRAASGGRAFYLEATVCGQSEHSAGPLRAKKNEIDAVEKIRSALQGDKIHMHSHLWLEAEGNLEDTLSKRSVAKPFIELLIRTSTEEVHRSLESGLPLQAMFTHGEWTLQGRLRPKSPKSAVGHVLGPARLAMGDSSNAITTSLAKKAKKWRKLGPGRDGILVIALAVCHSHYFWNEGDEIRAIVRDSANELSTAPWRDELRGVTGVLFVDNISLRNELRTRARLLQNPDQNLPESLAFLTTELKLAELTGILRHTQDAR